MVLELRVTVVVGQQKLVPVDVVLILSGGRHEVFEAGIAATIEEIKKGALL